MADFVTMNDLMSLKDRLISWGFAENNIRTFFANGINMSMDDGECLFYSIMIIQTLSIVVLKLSIHYNYNIMVSIYRFLHFVHIITNWCCCNTIITLSSYLL